ncbi:MAG: hypothetical protein V7K57_28435 [Nostoc sp.]
MRLSDFKSQIYKFLVGERSLIVADCDRLFNTNNSRRSLPHPNYASKM